MFPVNVGVYYCDTYPQGAHPCKQPNLRYTGHVAETFLAAMASFGHDHVLLGRNDGARSSDFDHPQFGGNSLNGIDRVTFGYYGGHGGQVGFEGRRVQALGFTSNHSPPNLAPCFTMSAQWRLGVRFLKWLLLDSCEMVTKTDPNHIVEVWSGPMRGVHLILGFIDLQRIGPGTYNRRALFAQEICHRRAVVNTWLTTAYGWENPNDPVTRPFAIAAGATRDEAINRREWETLDWQWSNVTATNFLAWKYRT